MKKNLSLQFVMSLSCLLLFSACQKEQALSPAVSSTCSESITELSDNSSTCRLTFNKDEYGNLNSFQYNDRGLVEKWVYSTTYGFKEVFKVKYNSNNQVSASWYEFDGNAFRVEYQYENDRIIKEFWFVGNTEIVDDTILVTYNDKGKVAQYESRLYQFYSTFEYDASGNAYQVNVTGFDGYLYVATTYQFTKKIKDPYRALPGLPFALQYANLVFNTYRPTGIRTVVTGEDGSLVTLFDYDPATSILRAGQGNYPFFQKYYDQLSGTWYAQAWKYENCEAGATAADPSFSEIIPPASGDKAAEVWKGYYSMPRMREYIKATNLKRNK